jgi:hypothetical protein
MRDGQTLVERGDPDQGVVGTQFGVHLVGRHFGEEVVIGAAAQDSRIVVRLVEVLHGGRSWMRLQGSGDDAGLTVEQPADLRGRGVRYVPRAIDGLIECQVRDTAGVRELAVVDVDVREIGDIQRHGRRRVLLEHRDGMSHLEPRRPVVGPKVHGDGAAKPSTKFIAHAFQAHDGVGLKGP